MTRSPVPPPAALRAPALLAPLLLLLLGCAQLPGQAPVSPAEHLGRPVGTDRQLADWRTIGEWFDALGAGSERVTVTTVGTSTEGRPFRIAIVTSEENHARLEEIRSAAARIADPRGLALAEREALLARARPIFFISCNMHSTEIAAAEMSMELAWRLATSDEEPWVSARREIVTVIVPTMNPDGLDDVVDWYRRIVDTPYESAGLPELYQLFAGHDNNRDWFALSLEETRIVTRLLYTEWHPQVYWDVHQQGSRRERLFVPPFRDPLNPNLDPAVIAGIGALGGRAMLDLTRAGFTGVSSGVTYDMWWNGGNRNVPVRHNIIGLLSEAASANLASPIFLPPAELEAPSGIETGYAPSNRFPAPWPGGWWRIGDIVRYELALAESLLASVAREPGTWLRAALEVAERTVVEGAREAPRGWLIPPGQMDGGALRRLLGILLAQGVEVGRATEPFSADGVEYPAGTLVLPRSQPYGTFLRDLFEVQRYPNGPTPYDVTGWTLPLLFGVRRVEVVGELIAATEPVTDPGAGAGLLATPVPHRPPADEGGAPSARVAVSGLSGRDTDTIRHLVSLLSAGAAVRFVEALGENAGEWVPAAGWEEKVRGAGLDPAPIAAALRPLGETKAGANGAPELGGTEVAALPRVAVYAPWTASMDEGWLRWTLEHVGFPYTQLRNARVRAGDLRRDFDVLVLPSVPARTLREGRKEGSVFPELAGGLDPEGSIAIEEFVRAGGTLIACESACEYAIELFHLPVTDVTKGDGAKGFACPGSVLRTVPSAARIAAGLPLSQPIFFSGSSAFRPNEPAKDELPRQHLALGEWEPLLHVPASQILLSGSMQSPETIAGAAAWGRIPVGDGTVHLFGFRPHYRSWSHGSFWLLFRAVLLG